MRDYLDQYLRGWATKGVTVHFTPHEDAYLPKFIETDEAAANLLAPIVGASPDEVAAMGTLTTNLHLLMASFYRPTKEKTKIILESRAFPSDHVCKSTNLAVYDTSTIY
jgi:kynureninase